MKTLYFAIACLVYSVSLSGQSSPYVTNTPTTLPQSPSSSSQVTLITSATTANSGFKISSTYSVNHATKTIWLESCYYGGMLTALKTYVDTFQVGTLQAGLYSVIFKASESSSTQSCVSMASNSISTSINVSGLTTSFKTLPKISEPGIFPNPVKNKLHVLTDSEITCAEIYAINGSKIKVFKANSGHDLDISELNDGVYILKLQTRDKTTTKRFVKFTVE